MLTWISEEKKKLKQEISRYFLQTKIDFFQHLNDYLWTYSKFVFADISLIHWRSDTVFSTEITMLNFFFKMINDHIVIYVLYWKFKPNLKCDFENKPKHRPNYEIIVKHVQYTYNNNVNNTVLFIVYGVCRLVPYDIKHSV